MKLNNIVLCLLILFFVGCGGPSFDKEVIIGTQGNLMKYDVAEISAKAGSTLKIVFKNNANMATMKHNIVFIKNEKFIKEIGEASANEPDYLVEEHEGIIAYTDMIGPYETTELIFNVPSLKGRYPFICTFPGHYSVMKGILEVN